MGLGKEVGEPLSLPRAPLVQPEWCSPAGMGSQAGAGSDWEALGSQRLSPWTQDGPHSSQAKSGPKTPSF